MHDAVRQPAQCIWTPHMLEDHVYSVTTTDQHKLCFKLCYRWWPRTGGDGDRVSVTHLNSATQSACS